MFAAIEAGGTKFLCALGRGPEESLQEARIETTTPVETMAAVGEFFRRSCEVHGEISAVGIGTFGPVSLEPEAADFGCLLQTPKAGWSGFPLVATLRREMAFEGPLRLETDVGAAVLAEAAFGAGQGLRAVAYLTVGTGIGGAYLHDGVLLRGRMHPEVGHMLLPGFVKGEGVCPFHQGCLEGQASGPALQAQTVQDAGSLPPTHPAWEAEAHALAACCLNLTALWSPERIILGGGVTQHQGLFPRIREAFQRLCGRYWSLPPLEDYIQPAALEQRAGLIGAFLLAQQALGG